MLHTCDFVFQSREQEKFIYKNKHYLYVDIFKINSYRHNIKLFSITVGKGVDFKCKAI